MEKVDMQAVFKEECSNDPIYRMTILNGLEDCLFTKGILSLHKDLSYSTVETGRIIERSDSTIRNHFRSDLVDYIAPERFGKYYRLNYQCIFRLHMIFVLMEKASKTTVDILAELGMQPGITMGGNIKRVSRGERSESRDLMVGNDRQDEDNFIEDRFQKLEYAIGLQGIMVNILKYEKDIAEIERKIVGNQSIINQITSESRMKFLEEKQSQLLANSLRKTIKKQTFLGIFKKNEDIDINKIADEIDQNMKEKYEKEIQSKINGYESEIKKLGKDKESLMNTLLKEKESFSNFQKETDNNKLISGNSLK